MTPDRIRNIGIFAHVDAGKTTLTEQMLLASGALRHAGSVDEGTAQTDWLPIERARGISVRAAQISFLWRGTQINLIDTPGHADFAGEAERSLAAIDGAVLVISAVEGVQPHAENIWRALEAMGVPMLIFVNKIDRAGSRFEQVCASFPESFEAAGTVFPVLRGAAGEGTAEPSVFEPQDLPARLTEALAEHDDAAAEAFLEERELDGEALEASLAACVRQRRAVPVFAGCAQRGIGVEALLDGILALLPPADKKSAEGLSALVFKIEHDRTMGKLTHVRMFSGELRARDTLTLPGGQREKITQIRKYNGQKYTDAGYVGPGDIAVLCGLSSTRVLDALGEPRASLPHGLANAFLSVRVIPESEDRLPALLTALRELSEEDPLLDCKWEPSERELLISCTGKIQLEVIAALLLERYGLTVSFSEPSVIYRETPPRAAEGFDAYLAPKPCWAVVRFGIEPLPRGAGVVYDGGKVPNNTCFYRYQEHIRRSFFESLAQGPLGWEVTDLKVTLLYAEHHTIHTHPLDFFVCTPMALMNGLKNAGTGLLEPFLSVRVSAGSEYLSRVIGDVTQMRGEFDAPVLRGDAFTLEAALPVATSLEYPVRLAGLSHGTALYASRFLEYRPCATELGRTARRRGPDPLDRAKWILYARDAITGN